MDKGGSKYEQDFIWNALDDIWGASGSSNEVPITSLPDRIKQVETDEIEDALLLHNGNVAAAGRHLGLGRTRLIARMKVLRIKKGR
jgi:transcriptional regulator with GAF, ATPase, and Fis domain